MTAFDLPDEAPYIEYYGLLEPPFNVTGTDTRFAYLTDEHWRIVRRCLEIVRDRMGLAVIYGDPGIGKSTLSKIIYDRLSGVPEVNVIYLDDPSGTPSEVMRYILNSFKIDTKERQVERLKSEFRDFVIEQTQRQDKRVVIIVDEAQTLQRQSMELVRTLLNFEVGAHKDVQFLLFGETRLMKMKVATRPNFASRIIYANILTPLLDEETRALIEFRLKRAGRDLDLFEQAALKLWHERSEGIPRRICAIGYNTLMVGEERAEQVISAQTVHEAAKMVMLTDARRTTIPDEDDDQPAMDSLFGDEEADAENPLIEETPSNVVALRPDTHSRHKRGSRRSLYE